MTRSTISITGDIEAGKRIKAKIPSAPKSPKPKTDKLPVPSARPLFAQARQQP